MKGMIKYRKGIALLLFWTMSLQLLMPVTTHALTSGPSQPEMKGFEPIGNTDMVDLFSGDFSYNIPLLDVGGYPVNLAYGSGAGMDDEASWTGYGWNLNVGSVNRQLRGLPDDFNGADKMEREMNMKDHVTKGGRFSMTVDLLGMPTNKIKAKKKKKKINMSLTVSIGIKSDNYRGIGMEVGINPGLSFTDDVALENNTSGAVDSFAVSGFQGGGGLTLSSQDGATFSVNADIIRKNLPRSEKVHSLSKSIGFGYNSRAGLSGMTLSSSFNILKLKEDDKGIKKLKRDYDRGSSSFISFNGDTYTPTIDHATKSESYTFSLHLGPELWVAFGGLGVSGFYSKQKVAQQKRFSPAFGFMHSEKAIEMENEALTDFNREKDIPYSSQVKYLPIPVPAYDLFTAASQDGGGQYRLYRGSSGVFFDQKTETTSDNLSIGIEAGGGTYFDIGADLYKQDIKSITQKWTKRNDFLAKGDFQRPAAAAPLYEAAYFKRVGEPVPYDNSYVDKLKGTSPVAVSLPGRIDNAIAGAKASDLLRTKSSPNGESVSVLKRENREVRNTTFSFLTAGEAVNHSLDKTILDYHPDSVVVSGCIGGGIRNMFSRNGDHRKSHHISEITVTGDDGKRSIYGIPVYNTYQEEVTFSVTQNLALRNKGLIAYNSQDNSTANTKGRDNYYSKEKTPPYTTSFLLSAILSPDYVDKTGDGVTDDDLGTAVKFNYSKLPSLYKWRTPFAFGPDTANYNEGFLSDALDDKANYVYGEKEVWYLHSVESKTMLAHFVTEDRDDALGVTGSNGLVNNSVRLKRLKEIRLYSKSDIRLNGNDLSKVTPIKTVHFVYDYSICRGLPNSIDNTGKLTLKRIYFTFGHNQKGRLNPYDFHYDTTYNYYDYRQYDRWGSFKDAGENPGSLNNSEFPYTLQDTALTNAFVRIGQLNRIVLPSGGSIHISYESDDYAFVQDKRASVMCMLNGVGSQSSETGLINADYIYVNLPHAVANSQEMRDRYFEGITNLYYKFLLDLDGKGHKEFVPGYAEIDPFVKPELAPGTDDVAKIKLKKIKNINPVAKAGWQFIRTNLPKYAYPGSENLESNQSDIVKVIKAYVAAFASIKELVYGFDARAKSKGYSNNVDLEQSWVRLCSPEWKKSGGGSRVSRIDITDDWAAMSETDGALTSTYTQLYDYSMKDAKNRTISSGVASYEPMLGNDENPFRQPIRYGVNQFLGLNNYYYIEEPFGESFFPGASVGYSQVTVRTIGTGDEVTVNRTGTVVSEFYTAKDYPTKVEVLGLEHRKPATDKLFRLIGGISYEMVGLSQGYAIELNDMHGKPKSVKVYNKSGQIISSVEHFYKSGNELAARKELNNGVQVIHPDGTVSDGMIGMDIEMFTDMRQQSTENIGVSVKISGGSGAILIFPLPFFFPGIGVNYDKRNFRASSTVKIIHRFAIQHKTVKMENGSTITSENLLWDAETGNVLLTKTQNEFDDPVYSFAYPAHWVYEGMGQAYKNLGTVITGFSSNSNGEINSSATYNSLLQPGDELINVLTQDKYWVINTSISSVYNKRLIDETGELQEVNDITVKLIRSGKRNMANTAIATIVSLNNPIVGNKVDVSQLSKVLDAKATVFEEEWSMPVSSNLSVSGNSCDINAECFEKLLTASFIMQPHGRPYFYTFDYDSLITVADIISSVYGPNDTACFENFLNGKDASELRFYLHGSYDYPNEITDSILTIQIGDCMLQISNMTANFLRIGTTTIPDTLHLFSETDHCGSGKFKIIPDTTGGISCNYSALAQYDTCFLSGLASLRLECPGSCINPVDQNINPYFAGILGNWRPKSSFVYQVSRENHVSDPGKFGSTNIRKSGAYSIFNPFWKYDAGWQNNPTNDIRWIAANEVTYFNSKGMEVENKDALNRYSSAIFGYLESMPVAVASNSRYREIAYDNFEDYGFTLDCSITDSCNAGHFDFRQILDGSTIDTTSLYAHSGKYSLKLNGTATVSKTVFLDSTTGLFSIDNSGKYKLTSNELAKGFSPIPGNKYVLSFWVWDNSPRNAGTYVQATINGSDLLNTSLKWPIVEGWKRVEVPFTLSGMSTSFSLNLNSGDSTVYIDDIRIHPFDGQMKSFAYDPSSQRLMAEMDENNFATFYEYDDEGILIRVKKETERGIMTIKETRSSYRKRQ